MPGGLTRNKVRHYYSKPLRTGCSNPILLPADRAGDEAAEIGRRADMPDGVEPALVLRCPRWREPTWRFDLRPARHRLGSNGGQGLASSLRNHRAFRSRTFLHATPSGWGARLCSPMAGYIRKEKGNTFTTRNLCKPPGCDTIGYPLALYRPALVLTWPLGHA